MSSRFALKRTEVPPPPPPPPPMQSSSSRHDYSFSTSSYCDMNSDLVASFDAAPPVVAAAIPFPTTSSSSTMVTPERRVNAAMIDWKLQRSQSCDSYETVIHRIFREERDPLDIEDGGSPGKIEERRNRRFTQFVDTIPWRTSAGGGSSSVNSTPPTKSLGVTRKSNDILDREVTIAKIPAATSERTQHEIPQQKRNHNKNNNKNNNNVVSPSSEQSIGERHVVRGEKLRVITQPTQASPPPPSLRVISLANGVKCTLDPKEPLSALPYSSKKTPREEAPSPHHSRILPEVDYYSGRKRGLSYALRRVDSASIDGLSNSYPLIRNSAKKKLNKKLSRSRSHRHKPKKKSYDAPSYYSSNSSFASANTFDTFMCASTSCFSLKENDDAEEEEEWYSLEPDPRRDHRGKKMRTKTSAGKNGSSNRKETLHLRAELQRRLRKSLQDGHPKRKSVRFANPTVTMVQYRPYTEEEDIPKLYFQEEELENFECDREEDEGFQVECLVDSADLTVRIAYRCKKKQDDE